MNSLRPTFSVKARRFLAFLGAWISFTALAHSVWIEPFEGGLVVRFAEPDGRFENSPGHLDSLSIPAAFVSSVAGPAAIEAIKKTNHFLLPGCAPSCVVCAETMFTVRGNRKPHFYARWQPWGAGAATPSLTLDLVPTGKAGEVRAYFRGQPLGGVKATLRTPDDKEEALTADAEGYLRFMSSLSGQHLLTVAHHRETQAGFHGGRAYQQSSHNASLTWRQP